MATDAMAPRDSSSQVDDERSKLESGRRAVSKYTPRRRTVLAGISAALAATLATNLDTVDDVSDTLRSGNNVDDSAPLDIVPKEEVTHRAVRSGQWSAADVWAENRIPGDDARVLIEPGTTVTLASETASIKTARVDGTLAFDTAAESHLRVDTMVTTPESHLRIGTPDDPMQTDAEARITFLDFGPIDETVDSDRIGRGLIVMGEFTAHGSEKTSWTTLNQAPTAGEDTLLLSEAPTNWTAGDTVVVPDTTPPLGNQDEEATIADVNGTEVRLEDTLEYDHVPPEADLDNYVLNLTRNVRFESENDAVPRRGHIIIHSQATDTRYVGCYDLGRTNKSYPFTNPQHGKPPKDVPPNPRARYAFHFHRTGIEAPPHYVEGVVVHGSPGWGVVNHHSHAEVTDSITYDVFGAGFVAEAGNERGSFKHNFALRSEGSGELIDARRAAAHNVRRGDVDDFGHGGHGFWLQGPLVEVEDNVAAGHRHFAYVFWNRSLVDRPLREGEELGRRIGNNPNVPIEHVDGQEPLKESEQVEGGKVPASFVRIKSFADNEAFASGGGIDISRHQFHYPHTRYDEYGVIDSFTAYNIGPLKAPNGGTIPTGRGNKQGGNIGVNIRFARNILVRDARLVGVAPPPNGESPGRGKSVGVHRNTPYGRTVYVEDSAIEDWEVGIKATVEGFTVVRGTVLDNHINVDVPMNKRATLIEDNEFKSGDTAHAHFDWNLEGTRPQWLFGDDWRHGVEVDGRTAYYRAQAPDFVPVPSKEALERLTSDRHAKWRNVLSDMINDDPEAVIGKTNQELSAEFDITVRGAMLPDAAERDWRLSSDGLLQSLTGEAPDNEVWLEAQEGSVGDAFSVLSDPNASLGKCIVAEGVATAEEPPPDDGIATYKFEVESGSYNVYARAHAPQGDDGPKDSLWVRLDEGEWISWEDLQTDHWKMLKIDLGFLWAAVEASDGKDLREFELDAGEHVLEIGYRGSGLKIDKLLIAADETTPVDRGHPADNA